MSSLQEYDVVIVGGGIVGLVFAGLLQASRLKVAVIESNATVSRWPLPEFDRRVSAITRASENIFKSVGAWSAMQAMRVTPYYNMQVWDAGGNGEVQFSCRDVGEANLGTIIENSVVSLALLEQLQSAENITVLRSAQAKSLLQSDKQIIITLDNGQSLSTRLLVGADGANSWVRDQFGIELVEKPYGHNAIVATVVTEKPHQHTARQRFLPTGPLAFLPLNDLYTSSIVWSVVPDKANFLMQLPDEKFCHELNLASEQRLGNITKCSTRHAFELISRHAKNYVKPRAALIGDALHTIHPLAGQGVNLGILDAACLAETILGAQQKDRDVGAFSTLRRYERQRKLHNLSMLWGMEAFKTLFSREEILIRQARNLGLQITNQSNFLKSFFIKQAMGV